MKEKTTKKEYEVEITETRILVFEMEKEEVDKYIDEFNANEFADKIKAIAKHSDRYNTDIDHLQEYTEDATETIWK